MKWMCFVLLSWTLPTWAGDVFEKTYDFSPGATLTIELEPGGNLTVVGEARGDVFVQYPINQHNRDFEITESRDGSHLTLVGDRPEKHKRFALDMTVKVPNKMNLKFYTAGGNLVLKDLDGDIQGKTMGGNVKLDHLVGDIALKTMGGNIGVTDSELEGDLHTMGGNIKIEGSIGFLDCKTMGGNIVFDNDGTYEMNKSGNKMKLTTMGGNIELREAPGGVEASTMGGNIHVGHSWGFVDVDTKGGNITIDALDGGVSADTYGGNIGVTVISGAGDENRDIDLRSKGGEVTLVLPNGFSAQFDVQLDITRTSRDDYEIISDFLNVSASSGKKDRTLRGVGMLGDGTHQVKIRTVNGDVKITTAQ